MAREVAGLVKLQVKDGAADPSPPVGPALGSKGINIMGFYKESNAGTQDKAEKVIPAIITYYINKSFDFVLEIPPAAVQFKEMAKLKTASVRPSCQEVASVTWDQVRIIAEDKMADLSYFTIESAMRLVAGTARSMGVTIKGEFPGNN